MRRSKWWASQFWCVPKFIVLATVAAHVHAGSYPLSNSRVDGYFLGDSTDAYVSISGNSKRSIKRLINLCQKKQNLWALGIEAPFKCTGLEKLNGPQGFDEDVIHVKMTPSVRISRRTSHPLLFSVTRFPNRVWEFRKTDEYEIEDLTANAFFKHKKYKKAIENINAGNVKVVEPINGKATIYLIPWRTTSDGIVDEADYIVAVKSPNSSYTFKVSRGRVVGFVDLDGDGIPEIQESMTCDGVCESAYSVFKPSEKLISIYVH